MTSTSFYHQHYISIDQISHLSDVQQLFTLADQMKRRVEAHQRYEPLTGHYVAVLFYQPSTRTFSSFVAAAQRLGAKVVAIHGMAEYSSVSKGESLEDTIRSIYQTTAADAIVLRHPDNNSSQIAAGVSPVPIINAGSGTLEHPSQALLDLYTIHAHFGRLDHLHVVMVGDLLYGRTIKSLAKLLAMGQNNHITFVSPPELQAPSELISSLDGKVTVQQVTKLNGSLRTADVVYMTRVQKEWFVKANKLDEYERIKDTFVMTRRLAALMPENSIIMHPLPRVGEISPDVDEDHRCKYFDQMRSGLYVRMALLHSILVKDHTGTL